MADVNVPDWMIQKTRIQSQKNSNKINRSTIGNQITIKQRWFRALDNWSRQVGVTRDELVHAADLQDHPDYLLPPNN